MLTDSLLAGLLLALSRAAPLHTPPTDRVEVLPSVTLLCGDNNVSIQGTTDGLVDSYFGVPFAAPRKQV